MNNPMLDLWYQYHDLFIDNYSLFDIICGFSEITLTASRDTVINCERRFQLHPLLLSEVEDVLDNFQDLLKQVATLRSKTCFIIDPHDWFRSTFKWACSFEALDLAWTGVVHRLCLASDWFTIRCFPSDEEDVIWKEVRTSGSGRFTHLHARQEFNSSLSKWMPISCISSPTPSPLSASPSIEPLSTGEMDTGIGSAAEGEERFKSAPSPIHEDLLNFPVNGARVTNANGQASTEIRLAPVCGLPDPSTDIRLGGATSTKDSPTGPQDAADFQDIFCSQEYGCGARQPPPSDPVPSVSTSFVYPSLHDPSHRPDLSLTQLDNVQMSSMLRPSNEIIGHSGSDPGGPLAMESEIEAVGVAGISVGGDGELVSKFRIGRASESFEAILHFPTLPPPLLDPGPTERVKICSTSIIRLNLVAPLCSTSRGPSIDSQSLVPLFYGQLASCFPSVTLADTRDSVFPACRSHVAFDVLAAGQVVVLTPSVMSNQYLSDTGTFDLCPLFFPRIDDSTNLANSCISEKGASMPEDLKAFVIGRGAAYGAQLANANSQVSPSAESYTDSIRLDKAGVTKDPQADVSTELPEQSTVYQLLVGWGAYAVEHNEITKREYISGLGMVLVVQLFCTITRWNVPPTPTTTHLLESLQSYSFMSSSDTQAMRLAGFHHFLTNGTRIGNVNGLVSMDIRLGKAMSIDGPLTMPRNTVHLRSQLSAGAYEQHRSRRSPLLDLGRNPPSAASGRFVLALSTSSSHSLSCLPPPPWGPGLSTFCYSFVVSFCSAPHTTGSDFVGFPSWVNALSPPVPHLPGASCRNDFEELVSSQGLENERYEGWELARIHCNGIRIIPLPSSLRLMDISRVVGAGAKIIYMGMRYDFDSCRSLLNSGLAWPLQHQPFFELDPRHHLGVDFSILGSGLPAVARTYSFLPLESGLVGHDEDDQSFLLRALNPRLLNLSISPSSPPPRWPAESSNRKLSQTKSTSKARTSSLNQEDTHSARPSLSIGQALVGWGAYIVEYDKVSMQLRALSPQVLRAINTASPDNRFVLARRHADSFPDNRLDEALRSALRPLSCTNQVRRNFRFTRRGLSCNFFRTCLVEVSPRTPFLVESVQAHLPDYGFIESMLSMLPTGTIISTAEVLEQFFALPLLILKPTRSMTSHESLSGLQIVFNARWYIIGVMRERRTGVRVVAGGDFSVGFTPFVSDRLLLQRTSEESNPLDLKSRSPIPMPHSLGSSFIALLDVSVDVNLKQGSMQQSSTRWRGTGAISNNAELLDFITRLPHLPPIRRTLVNSSSSPRTLEGLSSQAAFQELNTIDHIWALIASLVGGIADVSRSLEASQLIARTTELIGLPRMNDFGEMDFDRSRIERTDGGSESVKLFASGTKRRAGNLVRLRSSVSNELDPNDSLEGKVRKVSGSAGVCDGDRSAANEPLSRRLSVVEHHSSLANQGLRPSLLDSGPSLSYPLRLFSLHQISLIYGNFTRRTSVDISAENLVVSLGTSGLESEGNPRHLKVDINKGLGSVGQYDGKNLSTTLSISSSVLPVHSWVHMDSARALCERLSRGSLRSRVHEVSHQGLVVSQRSLEFSGFGPSLRFSVEVLHPALNSNLSSWKHGEYKAISWMLLSRRSHEGSLPTPSSFSSLLRPLSERRTTVSAIQNPIPCRGFIYIVGPQLRKLSRGLRRGIYERGESKGIYGLGVCVALLWSSWLPVNSSSVAPIDPMSESSLVPQPRAWCSSLSSLSSHILLLLLVSHATYVFLVLVTIVNLGFAVPVPLALLQSSNARLSVASRTNDFEELASNQGLDRGRYKGLAIVGIRDGRGALAGNFQHANGCFQALTSRVLQTRLDEALASDSGHNSSAIRLHQSPVSSRRGVGRVFFCACLIVSSSRTLSLEASSQTHPLDVGVVESALSTLATAEVLGQSIASFPSLHPSGLLFPPLSLPSLPPLLNPRPKNLSSTSLPISKPSTTLPLTFKSPNCITVVCVLRSLHTPSSAVQDRKLTMSRSSVVGRLDLTSGMVKRLYEVSGLAGVCDGEDGSTVSKLRHRRLLVVQRQLGLDMRRSPFLSLLVSISLSREQVPHPCLEIATKGVSLLLSGKMICLDSRFDTSSWKNEGTYDAEDGSRSRTSPSASLPSLHPCRTATDPNCSNFASFSTSPTSSVTTHSHIYFLWDLILSHGNCSWKLLMDGIWALPTKQLSIYAVLSRVGGATTYPSHFTSLLCRSGFSGTFLLGGKGGIGISPPFRGQRTNLWSLRKIDIQGGFSAVYGRDLLKGSEIVFPPSHIC